MVKTATFRVLNTTDYDLNQKAIGNKAMAWSWDSVITSGDSTSNPVAFNSGSANGFVEYELQGGVFRILADNSHGARLSVVNQSVPSSSLVPTQSKDVPWKEGGIMTLKIKASGDGGANFEFDVAS